MLIRDNPPLHLTYCLNVHPGESWQENLQAVTSYAAAVKRIVAPGKVFGLGLRLGNAAARQLSQDGNLEKFKTVLAEQEMYALTVNGFPYGRFHAEPVKQNVYRPDWREKDRLEYTMLLADILARLLPDAVTGSISTVPGSFKPWIQSDSDVEAIVENLARFTSHAAAIMNGTGKTVTLALEPEPDCFLETTSEVLDFFDRRLLPHGTDFLVRNEGMSAGDAERVIRRHVGVCFDTCHHAVQFEDLPGSLERLRAEGIRICKVQLSAALRVPLTGTTSSLLEGFFDPVYLHQCRIKGSARQIVSLPDLSAEALAAAETSDDGELRCHFHVPLYFRGDGELDSTASLLNDDFFDALAGSSVSTLEIETYTFDVLPEAAKETNIVDSIAAEYRWVLERVGGS